MEIIKTQEDLIEVCTDFAQAPYITVDTEFLREKTYWSILCLIQMARPAVNGGDDRAVIIDPMVDGLDMTPFYALMSDQNVTKVLHACRQDIEIFHHEGGVIPTPLFDTQIAAMVCGFGDQVGYERLVKAIAKTELDKSSRFTDWSQRPLNQKQLNYAIGDVTHLRVIYEQLLARLEREKRTSWLDEEMAILKDPATYFVEPKNAWKRLKTRTNNPRFLSVAVKLAEWRENEAQHRNIPRGRIIKDDALLELCAAQPKNMDALFKCRLIQREARKPETSKAILAAIQDGLNTPEKDQPVVDAHVKQNNNTSAISDLLKVLLKAQSERLDIAPKLLASSKDLEAISSGETDVPAMKGWRFEAFGKIATQLVNGEIAISGQGRKIKIIKIDHSERT